MKIIAIISQKGGAGEDDISCPSSRQPPRRLDARWQLFVLGSTGHCCQLGIPPEGRRAGGRQRTGSANSGVGEAADDNGADFLVLDTAPNADQTASLAARAADLVLIPCRPAAFDLEAIETTLLLAKAAGKPAYVVLNAVPPRSFIGKEASAGLVGRGAQVAPIQLSHRAAFAHGVIDGRTAQEFEPNGKAAQEIEHLYRWLCGVVGVPTRRHARKAA